MSTNAKLSGSRASYTWRIEGALIVIEDWNQGRSVTNDAERIIAGLVSEGVEVDRFGVMYRDSMGTWDGISTENGQFAGFFSPGTARLPRGEGGAAGPHAPGMA